MNKAIGLKERLLQKIAFDPITGCWAWFGYVAKNGYGQIGDGSKVKYAHRVAYELFKGEIPGGLDLDHLCRNRRCVNPDHLEAVTRRVNLLRGKTITASRASQTHCKNGHELSGDNLYETTRGGRACRTCRREAYRRWASQNRDRRRQLDRNFAERHRAPNSSVSAH